MLGASLEGFIKTDTGYSAHFDTLPQGELTFELCQSQNPEAYRDPYAWIWVLIPICIIALILLVIGGVCAVVVIPIVACERSRKKKLNQPPYARVEPRQNSNTTVTVAADTREDLDNNQN